MIETLISGWNAKEENLLPRNVKQLCQQFGKQLAEVEPFKTSIVLKFAREWPFVVYALTLLAAGLFVERFFCRYMCPLGAQATNCLALPGPKFLKLFTPSRSRRRTASRPRT